LKTICWDIDDVLNDLMLEWLTFHNHIAHTDIKYSDIQSNPPIGILIDEYLLSLDKFRECHFFYLKPIDKVLQWFSENGERFRHIALTAVPLFYSHISAQWVIKYFGNWIRSYNFIPSKRPGQHIFEYDISKADFIKRIGSIDLFIDDNENNINQAINLNIPTILFPRPWNSNRDKDIDCFIRELNNKLI